MKPSPLNAPALGLIRSNLWAIRPDALKELLARAPSPEAGLDIQIEDFFQLRPAQSFNKIGNKRVAHVWVQGPLMHSCPAIYEKLGIVTTYGTIQTELDQALAADAVVLHINSPGGTVTGNRELSEAIAAFPKPIITHGDGMVCSAAYSLAAGTFAIVASPSAQMGNIGTILNWADDTEFWAMMGIEWKALVSEGADLKAIGNLEPDEAQLKFLQELVDEAGFVFRSHVHEHRPSIDAEVWRAGWYCGEHAERLGLIDAMGTAEDAEAIAFELA